MQIFMKFKDVIYLVDIPSEREGDAYYYARELLMVPDNIITQWTEVVKNPNGVAVFYGI